MKKLRTILFALVLATGAGWLAGCGTFTDVDQNPNPWNAQESWEGPLPPTINQGR
jgi:hypothetical protein